MPPTAGSTYFNFPDTDFNGNDFPTNPFLPGATDDQKSTTLAYCAAKCAATPGCVLHQFGSAYGCVNCCWLKNKINVSTRVAFPGQNAYIGNPAGAGRTAEAALPPMALPVCCVRCLSDHLCQQVGPAGGACRPQPHLQPGHIECRPLWQRPGVWLHGLYARPVRGAVRRQQPLRDVHLGRYILPSAVLHEDDRSLFHAGQTGRAHCRPAKWVELAMAKRACARQLYGASRARSGAHRRRPLPLASAGHARV